MNRSRIMMVAVLVTGVTMLTGTSQAEESLTPKEMRYVGHGPSVMGIDKEAPADSSKKPRAYD